MPFGFPLYIDLTGNNCVVFGGGRCAASRVTTLLKFGAKVTVISPALCEELRILDHEKRIRYIPRKYYRGDCTNAYLCVGATSSEATNIAIADECKAKGVPVNLSKPVAFGNFFFPTVVLHEDIAISLSGTAPQDTIAAVAQQIEETLPRMLEQAENELAAK